MSLPRLAFSAAALVFALGTAGCGVQGSGVAAEERRTVAPFVELRADGAPTVVLTVKPGAAPSDAPIEIVVSGDDNLVPEVVTTVEDGVLEVRVREGQDLDPTLPLRVTATVPELRASRSEGSAEVRISGLDGESFSVQAADSSDVDLSGAIVALAIQSSGSADIRARGLVAGEVTIQGEGSSDVEVCAVEALHVSASGSADVAYFCSPETITTDLDGSADVGAGE